MRTMGDRDQVYQDDTGFVATKGYGGGDSSSSFAGEDDEDADTKRAAEQLHKFIPPRGVKLPISALSAVGPQQMAKC